MFTPDFYIESIQNAKKAVANAVIADKALNKAAHSYIDAQTAFAKVLVSNTIEVTRFAVEKASTVLFSRKDATA